MLDFLLKSFQLGNYFNQLLLNSIVCHFSILFLLRFRDFLLYKSFYKVFKACFVNSWVDFNPLEDSVAG